MGFACLEMNLINENSSQERQVLILFEAGYQSRKGNFTCRASCQAVLYSALGWQNETGLCQVCGCLASKAIRKAAGAAPRHGAVGKAEQGGLLCCQRLKAPAAFMVCRWATGLVACFSLGSAGFCSFPMGLVLYFAEHGDILRDSADFFVKSGPGNLSAETRCWLVCSGTFNSSIMIANALKGYCSPQACKDLQCVYQAHPGCLILLFSSGPFVL